MTSFGVGGANQGARAGEETSKQKADGSGFRVGPRGSRGRSHAAFLLGKNLKITVA